MTINKHAADLLRAANMNPEHGWRPPGSEQQPSLFQSTTHNQEGSTTMGNSTRTRRRDNSDDPQQQRRRRNGDNPRKQSDYQEEPGWGSMFHRPDNEGNQPAYTGQGLDPEGNPIELAVWVRKSASGKKYLRLHVQPPYEADASDSDIDDDDLDAGADDDGDDDDVPF